MPETHGTAAAVAADLLRARVAEVKGIIGGDEELARAVLFEVIEPALAHTRELTGDTHTEAAYLRAAIRGYSSGYCPHCLQTPRKGEQHLGDCPVGLQLAAAEAAAR